MPFPPSNMPHGILEQLSDGLRMLSAAPRDSGFDDPLTQALTMMARRRKLVLVPSFATMSLGPMATVSLVRGQKVFDGAQGPLIITGLRFFRSVGAGTVRLTKMQSGSRDLVIGDGVLYTLIAGTNSDATMSVIDGLLRKAPIVVKRDDPFSVELSVEAATLWSGGDVVISGYHTRELDGSLPGKNADALADDIRRELGEAFVASITLSGAADNDGFAAPVDIEWRKLALSNLSANAANRLLDARWRIGNHDVLPLGLEQYTAGSTLSTGIALPCRLLQKQGARLDVRHTAAGATFSMDFLAVGARLGA